jgi:hypothetical protein
MVTAYRSIFYTNGALLPEIPTYIIREADETASNALACDELIYVAAPRQMGKTSLLKRLDGQLAAQGWSCCFIDLSTMKNLERSRWFGQLGERVADACNIAGASRPIQDQLDFRTFLLNDVGLKRPHKAVQLILFLDEIEGLIGLDYSDEFLMTLRDMYQHRNTYPGRFLVAFAGAADPVSLVKDSTTSPFAIATEIALHDFTVVESKTLTSNLDIMGIPIHESVHDYIYGWVAGQPYLTQRICEIIGGWARAQRITEVSVQVVDQVIDLLLTPSALDRNLRHVMKEVLNLASFPAELWKRILAGNSVSPYEPGFYKLALTGAVIESPGGTVKIRNRIYEKVFSSLVGRRLDSPPPPPSQPQLGLASFSLQLTSQPQGRFDVRTVVTEDGSTSHCLGALPYPQDELPTVQKALQKQEYDPHDFTASQQKHLRRVKLLRDVSFVPEKDKVVGRALFETLLQGEVLAAFERARRSAKTRKDILTLQLRFDEDAVELAQYPWELLYDKMYLLRAGDVELIRHISYSAPAPEHTDRVLQRVLYIRSRPTDPPFHNKVEAEITQLHIEGIGVLDALDKPTFRGLQERLTREAIDVLHFDGHGVFARRCPTCAAMNYPRHKRCQAKQGDKICNQSLASVPARGYLAFETDSGSVDWIDNELLRDLFNRYPISLAMLSACRTGSVGDETLFSGVATALIQAGVPAVVSMQLPIAEKSAADFARSFYRTWAQCGAQFEALPLAVNAGRRQLMKTQEWFIPTLYLRSRDYSKGE